MNAWLRRRLAKVLAAVLCAGLAATWAVGKVLDRHDEVRRDQEEVARMTQKMKTVCVGRFLIDVPEDAQVELGRARIDGFGIAAVNEAPDEFGLRLAERESHIRAVPDWLGGDKNLESVREVNTGDGLSGKIFVHGRTVAEGTRNNGLNVERYRDEGVTVEALVNGRGLSFDLLYQNRGAQWIEDLPRLVHKLVPNPDNRIPDEPGFCLERAYVRDPLSADQREQITMQVQLPGHPDIEIMLMLVAGLKPEKNGILARSSASDAMLPMSDRARITRLRGAPREIAGFAGEEVVERFVEENDALGHSFWWETGGTEDNVLAPHMLLRMSTGNGNRQPVPSSLSDGAALGLWDRISSSIRLRPTKPRQPSQMAGPTTPLGTVASAGERCPESGWWLCADGGNGIDVLGGQRQLVEKGALMPQALLLPPRSLWDRIRGVQPSFESADRTFWKLVDKRFQKRLPAPLPLALPGVPAVAAGVAQPADAGRQQRVAVGMFAPTGAPCAASGWWRCEQSHALDGTRWFARGVLLPPATFAMPSGVFGRTSSGAKSIRRRGEWRLVRLAEAAEPSALAAAAVSAAADA